MRSGADSRFAAARTALAKPTYLLAAVLAVKLFVVRWIVFSSPDVLRFLVTDLSAAVLVAMAIEGRRLGRRSTVIAADAVFSTLLVVLLVFHSYYGRLPSLQLLGLSEQVGAVRASVFALLRPELVLMYADLAVIAALAWKRPAFFEARLAPKVRGTFVIAALLAAALDIGLGVVRPMPDFTLAAEARGIMNQEIADWLAREFVPVPETEPTDAERLQEQLDELRTGLSKDERASAEATGPLAGAGKGRNLILIVSESLQQFLLDRSVAGQPILPTIDALASEGYVFDRVYTQIAVGTTSDAELSLNTSLMPLENKPFAMECGERVVPSLPRLLKARGYTTMTFHSDHVTYWSRDKLYPSLGFDRFYDVEFFGKEDVIGLGASDDVIYGKALPVLKKTAEEGKPFYAVLLTMTAHDPFDLPADKRTLALPGDQASTRAGKYLIAEHYADAALGRFLEGLKREGLYKDSVIVVVGDHFGLQSSSMTAADQRVVESVIGRPYGEVDRLNVPFIIVVPGSGLSGVVGTPGGQVDFLPTVAGVMDLSLDGFVHLGRDLTVPGRSLIGMRYHNPTGTYVDDTVLAIPKGGGTFEAWSLQTGERLREAPADAAEKSGRIVQIEQLSDAHLRGLPARSRTATSGR